MKEKTAKKPDVLRVALRLALMAALFVGAGLVYYFAGSEPSIYEKIVIYALLAGVVAVAVQLGVWGFRWVKDERVSELGLHIVRFAVILTAVTVSVFAMMSADYTGQYNDSIKNELRQQALAARVEAQELLGQELGADGGYYDRLFVELPELLDDFSFNSNRHVNLYLFVEPDKQPPVLGFAAMEADERIFAAGTNSRLGVTASAEYIATVYTRGELAFSDYTVGENELRSAFVPVFTTAGRPVGVLEVCEQAQSSAALFGFTAIDLLLRVAALICLFSFGFYGVMQLIDIALRPHNFDRSRRVLSCGREAARPVLFFVSLGAALPVMLLMFSGEMRGLIALSFLPEAFTALVPVILYILCFLIGALAVRKVGTRLTEMPSNLSLAVATVCGLLLLLINDTSLFDGAGFMHEWYVTLLLVAVCGACYGVSYRTTRKYQAQSDMLFGHDKYVYLCTALGAITGAILGAWLLDASGEMGVKVAMLIINICTCVVSVWLLEDLENTVDAETRTDSRIRSAAPLMTVIVPLGLSLGFVWIYITGFLRDNGYSTTALSICVAAPVIAFCFGNRLRLSGKKGQRAAIVTSALLAGCAYLPMVWTASPVMAVVSCALLCLAVVFASAGVYSTLLPNERGRAFAGLLPAAAAGGLLSTLLPGFYAGRACIFGVGIATAVLGLMFLVSHYPERIPGANSREAITGETPEPVTSFAPPPVWQSLPDNGADNEGKTGGSDRSSYADYASSFNTPEEPADESAVIPISFEVDEPPARETPAEPVEPTGPQDSSFAPVEPWSSPFTPVEPQEAPSEPVKSEEPQDNPVIPAEPWTDPFAFGTQQAAPAEQAEQAAPEPKPEPEAVPNPPQYDWSGVDGGGTAPLDEFPTGSAQPADIFAADPAPAPSAFEDSAPEMPIIFPDANDEAEPSDPPKPPDDNPFSSSEGSMDFGF